MRVALVHDYLTEMGGAERVVHALTRIFPEAPLYTSVYDPRACPEFAVSDVRTTFMQRLTTRKSMTKAMFLLFPLAFRQLDLRGFDVVISSSSGFAHHVRVPEGAVHVCYCHTPPRFLWQSHDYFRGRPLVRRLLEPTLALLRRLDLEAADGVDTYVSNSATVAERIRRTYGREADVVHPPIDTSQFEVTSKRSGRFLVLSRLLAYKRIDLAVEAATRTRLPLDVIGDGPERTKLERLAGPTVRFLGRRPDDVVRHALARCAALVVPGTEDFGLTPLEVQASGRPPVAFAAGGALETVRDGETGFLFSEQTATSLADAMRRATAETLPAQGLRAWAERFDFDVFASAMESLVRASADARRSRPRRDSSQTGTARSPRPTDNGIDLRALARVWLRRVASLSSDARLADGPRSFLRLARVRLVPVGGGEVPVSLRDGGTTFDVLVRPRSSDGIVVTETFVGRYHVPPIASAEVRTILDLGANIGLTMAHLAALCPDARIVGVELDGENVRLARRNVARWGDRCKVIEGAAWVRDEPVRYRRAAGEECGAALAADGDREVRGLALEALLAEIGWDSVDYVKMDIEGAERAVLRENTGWASRVRSIKVETHAGYTPAECSADLERLGFTASVDLWHPAAVVGIRETSENPPDPCRF